MSGRIVLGLGNNIDYEIAWRSSAIEQLIQKYDIRASEPASNIRITSERDLLVSILGYLKNESGGERFVTSLDVILDFSNLFEKRITVGGTSIRAAQTIHQLGHTSSLHLVTINDDVRAMIPDNCRWVCSNTRDSLYPHLIVQYPDNTRIQVGDVRIDAKRANRIIYVHDPDSVEMRINSDLRSLTSCAEVFLISGFNAMQSSKLLAERLVTLARILQSLPSETNVFYEDACFHDSVLGDQVRSALMQFIDFYSMNEDEWQRYVATKVSLLDAGDVYKALQTVHRLIPVPVLVVHTRHWALAYGQQASQYMKPLQTGITMASTRYRLGDTLTHDDIVETEALPTELEARQFATTLTELAGQNICCIPSFEISESPATTVGLGDTFVGGFLSALLKD